MARKALSERIAENEENPPGKGELPLRGGVRKKIYLNENKKRGESFLPSPKGRRATPVI